MSDVGALPDLTALTLDDLKKLPTEVLARVAGNILDVQRRHRRENQLLYYKPASDRARKVHFSRAKYVGVSGGNRSGKSEVALVHLSALATGVFPQHDKKLNAEFRAQFRGPINVRTVVESFTTTLYPIILPKLKYSTWSGADEQGGERGHWGWIPKSALIDGSWDKSWTEKIKTLKIRCCDPETGEFLGFSQWQFMSKDQEPDDFASGTFHLVHHDEPPLFAQWRENQARTMEVGGRIFLTFTWPDDPSLPVDWIHEEIYEPATRAERSKNHEWFELWTTENVNLDQDSVAQQAAEWSEETKRVRLFGGSMRFSNRVHKDFTDVPQWWCFKCRSLAFEEGGHCIKCGNADMEKYCHVEDFDIVPGWPCVFVIDPHPRKPHMWLWAQIDPADDIRIVAEDELAGGPAEVWERVQAVEHELKLHTAIRLIDPNMGRSPSSAALREKTWQDEFDESGLLCELADDSSTGRAHVDEFLKPDPHTRRPRMIFHSRCHLTIHQMKRYTWDDYKTALEKDQKQTPRQKNDDRPTMLKYLMNHQPSFNWLKSGAPTVGPGLRRRGAY